MADLNTLLRWAVENSTATQQAEGVPVGEGMSLKFKPAAPGQVASHTAATLHPSDSQFPIADLSPASTPGPATPTEDFSHLPGQTAANTTLNTDILDLIMGKPDSLTMKEKMAFAVDENNDIEERVEALDDFEMLVELIDNANNMAVLKLWQPLLALFKSPHAEIVRHALWIAGTATQNNLKAQAALFINDVFPEVLDLIYSPDGKAIAGPTRAKAVYALSGAIKHWPLASAVLSANNDRGYQVLRDGVADAEPVIRRKMAFLLGTLVAQARDKHDDSEWPGEVRNLLAERAKEAGGVDEDLLKGLERTGVFASALKALGADGTDDVEFDENAIRALSRAAAAGVLSDAEKAQLKGMWAKWGADGRAERGLDGADGDEVAQAMA